MTSRTIDFYYDLISPFAHVALARLNELPADVTVRPVPVLLGAILNHWGQRGPAEISAKRLHTYRQSVFLGQQHGVDIRFPPRHPFNPLKALRLLAGANADLDTVRRAFGFVFEQGRAPDTDAELAGFAETVGIPLALAGDDAAKAALRANTEQAIARGVFGVPSFVCATASGHEVFWGVDSFDMLLAWLDDDTLFAREPYRHLDDVTVGIERK
ncbi:2-hydroxychromene-2-carboxylate isomerase [Hoeflea sp. IMCC20628]|uniref:2-hydroxychromene-2-carboxylate isomerase n=1 Tax=Hoeflea sp. IMCC20628 TaxID=1620421 RepID=UPI00063A9DA8|nr:2-hydroxychromene-2-carboxylate isomerase [Hoeflea sp. IMCC20628]AKI02701.1 2-hydroxychromene-2-carboxylate isomerase [Hoeflea sp. IMCC20628]